MEPNSSASLAAHSRVLDLTYGAVAKLLAPGKRIVIGVAAYPVPHIDAILNNVDGAVLHGNRDRNACWDVLAFFLVSSSS
jgi:hypothetical protein